MLPCLYPKGCFAATSMIEVALFGEDIGHKEVVGALVARVASEEKLATSLKWRSDTGGLPTVLGKLNRYLRDLERQGDPPDLLVVAVDSNREGTSRVHSRWRNTNLPRQQSPLFRIHMSRDGFSSTAKPSRKFSVTVVRHPTRSARRTDTSRCSQVRWLEPALNRNWEA